MVTPWIPHIASLDIPEFSKAASIAHVFPGMENSSFLSVVKICNEGYYITFRIDAVTIYSSAEKSHFEGEKRFEHRTRAHQHAA
jgi:hypothetical protein